MVYPEGIKCNLCGKELFEEMRFSLCPDCMPKRVDKGCLRCGRSISTEANYCLECQNKEQAFDRAYAPFIFEGNAAKLIYKLKYGNQRILAKELALFMWDCFLDKNFSPDVVTFVPMHKKRQKLRGYNQAQILAQEIGKNIGVEVRELLLRMLYTKNLARMNAQKRREAIENAIILKENEVVKGKKVLLIDDVFTTGVTSRVCSDILKNNGANRVEVLTFATSKELIDLY